MQQKALTAVGFTLLGKEYSDVIVNESSRCVTMIMVYL